MDDHGTPSGRLLAVLRRCFQAVEAEKGGRLRPVGLPAAHYSLLINVSETPGLSGAVLARRLGVTPQNVATLLSRLEGAGLLERRAHDRHGHVQEVYLTPEGEKLIRTADAVVAGVDADVVTLLGDEDAAQLRRILGRLTAGLTKAAPPRHKQDRHVDRRRPEPGPVPPGQTQAREA